MELIMAVWSGQSFLSISNGCVSAIQVILSTRRVFLKMSWLCIFKQLLIKSTLSLVMQQLMNMVGHDLSI